MLGSRRVIVDRYSEVADLLTAYADQDFFDFATHTIEPGALYVLGRAQYNLNKDRIRHLIETDTIKVILSNPTEGSDTLVHHCRHDHDCEDLCLSHKMLLISGGDMPEPWPALVYDGFLPKIMDYPQNLQAMQQIQQVILGRNKPYKFLFLNGRMRAHRKYLIEKFDLMGLLQQALWSNLEQRQTTPSRLQLWHNNQDLVVRPRAVKLLPQQYEVDRYQNCIGSVGQAGFVKQDLFAQEWGEIYLNARAYEDTYFSVVTETVFDYAHSFRTEKIWKPIAMGHPWIAVTNPGFYRDIQDLGFKTFSPWIDESFDQEPDPQRRIEAIAQQVQTLCSTDLDKFLDCVSDRCKYNQQHLIAMSKQVRREFPQRFQDFVTQHQFHE